MKLRKLIGQITVGMILPITVLVAEGSVFANEVKVKTSNVEALTSKDGSIYLNSGGTVVQVPSRSNYRTWYPWRYWHLPWGSNRNVRSHCRYSSDQVTSQVNHSGSSIIQSSINRSSCN